MGAKPAEAETAHEMPRIVAGRYEVEELLAEGGMARVYRVRDAVSGARVALKWLELRGGDDQQSRSIELLEREYHTLTQLAHPRIVQAFEYGLDRGNPFYTMELLDGGDLRELAPLPWLEVCRITYEVCSALSLLHSRNLVHLDLTPRNIRRTSDGKAKLIDFGLLSPMGPRTLLAGTPAYLAPEMVANISLDGRADLFSLGATMYYALTGRTPYPALRLQQLQDAWRTNPPPPSRLVKDIPEALDALVLSMIRLDVGSRPKSAAEVVERLLPLTGDPPRELRSVTHAYLSAPQLTGRDDMVRQFRVTMVRSLRGHGGGFLISGPPGIGRSRALDAFVLEAKLVGAVTLRASAADGAGVHFGAAAAIARQAVNAYPELALAAARSGTQTSRLFESEAARGGSAALIDLTRADLDAAVVHGALRTLLLQLAGQRALAIAVDDINKVDEASAALVASLATDVSEHAIVYAATVETSALREPPESLAVLRARAQELELSPLTPDELTTLLRSVFGDVAYLEVLSNLLYPLCGGRPRECTAIARQLVEQGVIRYTGGGWSLPEDYAKGQLPASMEEALDRRASQLSPSARRIAALLATGVLRRLSRNELLRSDGATSASVDQALDELLAAQLVTGDRRAYAVCHDGFARWIASRLDDARRREIHRQLARIYRESGVEPVAITYHLLACGGDDEGLSLLFEAAPDAERWERVLDRALSQLTVDLVARTLQLALRAAERLQRHPRELLQWRERLAHMSTLGDDPAYYYGVAEACVAQYKHDAGYDIWESLDPSLPDAARARQAIERAFARYDATPEEERVLSPVDAIRGLTRWVVITLPVAARISDLVLLDGVPALIDPFTSVSPMVATIARNAHAARMSRCYGRWQAGRDAWAEVLRDLDENPGLDMAFITRVRTAICFTLAGVDAFLGVVSSWADKIEETAHDPLQLAHVFYVRKLSALSEGDWEAAERHRRDAETHKLRTKSYQSLTTLLMELVVHAAARELTGLRQAREGIVALAEKHPGWRPVRHYADAQYARVVGDLEEALRCIEVAIAATEVHFPKLEALPTAYSLKVELLVDLGRVDEAFEFARPLLTRFRSRGVHHAARDIERALALGDARQGAHEAAMARMELVIAEQLELGISGLQLGLSYETAARIAIWARDSEAFERFSVLTAERYRPGQSSVLGALYERLQEEARTAGLSDVLSYSFEDDVPPDVVADSAWFTHRVVSALAGRETWKDRAMAALELICEDRGLRGGHLFLLTERGLELAASNIGRDGVDDAQVFVRRFLEAEIKVAGELKTQTMMPASEASGARPVWVSPDGTRFLALPVSRVKDGKLCIAGVAMVPDPNESVVSWTQLLGAITDRFIRDGDAKGAVYV